MFFQEVFVLSFEVFDRIADKQDELALLIRRKEQLKTIIDQLFPNV